MFIYIEKFALDRAPTGIERHGSDGITLRPIGHWAVINAQIGPRAGFS
jgi:hypothetical protein